MVDVIDDFWRDVVDRAGIDVFFMGNVRLVSRSDAARFAEWAAREKRILGFEGFTFDGENVSPLMECIADISALAKPDRGLEDTLKILETSDFQKPHFIEFELE